MLNSEHTWRSMVTGARQAGWRRNGISTAPRTRGADRRCRRVRGLRFRSNLDSLSAFIPSWKAMVETKRELSGFIHGHLMLILASQLGKCTNALVDPFITVYLLSARSLGWRRWRDACLSNNRIDLHLLKTEISYCYKTRARYISPEFHRGLRCGQRQ